MRVRDLYGEQVYYFFGDHLSSTNVITDPNGNVVSETLYKAWGEIRFSSGSLPTNYTYTGQRSEMEDTGLMFYNARWYDPELARFVQADSIVPGAGNPAAYDRYAYVLNNPIMMNDPSGHCYNYSTPEAAAKCAAYWKAKTKYAYGYILGTEFHWSIDADTWGNDELEAIYHAGKRIKKYVDNLTGGNGLKWMHEYLGGTYITHQGNMFKGISMAIPGWVPLVGSNTIFLANGLDEQNLVHELGHIWDTNSGTSGGLYGVVNGVSDYLNDFIGGDILRRGNQESRFFNFSGKWASSLVPNDYRYEKIRGKPNYANGSTADYLADSFMYAIYEPNKIPQWNVQNWIEVTIALETSRIP